MSTVQPTSGAERRDVTERDVSVETFVGTGESYYAPVFEKFQKGELPQ